MRALGPETQGILIGGVGGLIVGYLTALKVLHQELEEWAKEWREKKGDRDDHTTQ